MIHRSIRFPGVLSLLSLLPVLAGCGRQGHLPTAVAPEGAAASRAAVASSLAADPGFFPLQVGNHWTYSLSLVQYDPTTGGGSGGATTYQYVVNATLIGTQSVDGSTYTVERDDYSVPPSPAVVSSSQIWWRQDRTGLYERDQVIPVDLPTAAAWSPGRAGWERFAARIADPAKRAAWQRAWLANEAKLALVRGSAAPAATRSALPNELTRLLYPLHPLSAWAIRTNPLFNAVVEGHEALALAPGRFQGWRMRYTSELFGPRDVVRTWYGADGFLKLAARVESNVVDDTGNPVGTLVTEQTQVLTDIAIAPRGASSNPLGLSRPRSGGEPVR